MRYTYVRQHDTTDCAAACLAMVCLHYKKEITITRLRDMMGTDLKGTNLTGMEKAAQELGFSTAAVRVDRENFLSEFTTPCIAQVITDEGLAHFVTVFKKTTIKDDGERRRHMVRQEEERKKCADEGKKFRCRDYVIIGDPAKELKKISLDEFRERLAKVAFQEKLGSVLAKSERIEQLALAIAREAHLGAHLAADAARAAHLCKADLVSNAVVEFTSQQGVMEVGGQAA